MPEYKRLELSWLGKEIRPRIEPRILLKDKELSHCAKSKKKGDIFDNRLIFGDNLLALKALEHEFMGKVKCIYIDPPYNTGSAFEHYDDGVEHSLWLGLMRDRLELLRKLLSNDGMLFVQIDNRELHYLKVMMDEIFGRDNYRNTIIVRKGVKNVQKQFVTVERLNAGYDSILVYSKNSALRIPNLFGKLAQEDVKGSWNNHWRGTDRPTMRYELFGIIPPTGQWRWSKERTYTAVENYKTLQREEKSKVELLSQEDFDRMYEQYLYTHKIRDKKEFELVRLSKNGKPEHYIPPSEEILLSENWMDLAVVGRITSFEHEKNEFILQRILNWATNPGDLVLDSFLGSGTTAAVAHKMRRRWIGIELGEHCHTHCIPRLKKVIDGEDKGGITEAVQWEGGGGFRYFRLAPTTLERSFCIEAQGGVEVRLIP